LVAPLSVLAALETELSPEEVREAVSAFFWEDMVALITGCWIVSAGGYWMLLLVYRCSY
jgi:hypothetical protein